MEVAMNTNTLTITLASAKAHHACEPAYTLMQDALGPGWNHNDPFPLLRVLDVRGLKDTLWAFRCIRKAQAAEKRRIMFLWLADILKRVEDKMTDERSRAIIPLLREHALRPVSKVRWEKAHAAAWAADAAAAVNFAARGAADYYANYVVAAAAMVAADYATYYPYRAVYVVINYAAAALTDYAVEREWQTQRLRYYLAGEQTL